MHTFPPSTVIWVIFALGTLIALFVTVPQLLRFYEATQREDRSLARRILSEVAVYLMLYLAFAVSLQILSLRLS